MSRGAALTLAFGVFLAGALLVTSGLRNRSLSEVLGGQTSVLGEEAQAATVAEGAAPTGGAIGGPVAAAIKSALSALGLSARQIAGVTKVLKAESGLNTGALNPTEGAYGIAQWVGPRRSALESFASAKSLSASSAKAQAEYLAHELTTSEAHTLRALKGAGNEQQAARIFIEQYERPASVSTVYQRALSE